MSVAQPTADFFRALERERTAALVARDLPTIERLHAPDYQLITPAGRVFTRARYLERIAAEPFYAAWALGDIDVRVAPSMAIVRYQARLAFPSGKVIACWHTDSYELRGDSEGGELRWQAVWSQATQLPDETAAG